MYNEIINKTDRLTEDELQGLYMYLSLHFEEMNREEQIMWIELMKELDTDFYDTE